MKKLMLVLAIGFALFNLSANLPHNDNVTNTKCFYDNEGKYTNGKTVMEVTKIRKKRAKNFCEKKGGVNWKTTSITVRNGYYSRSQQYVYYKEDVNCNCN